MEPCLLHQKKSLVGAFKFLAEGLKNETAVWLDFHFKTSLSTPYMAIIEPTLRCPMRCKFCDLPNETVFPKASELSLDRWKRILYELREFSPLISDVYIAGGEPFFRADLCDIIETAHALGMRTRTLTIGAFLTPQVLDRLTASPMNWLKFSILSAREEVHNALVGRPVFKKSIAAVKYLRARGYSGKLGFLSSVWQGNVRELAAIVRMAEELSVDAVLFRPLFGNTQSVRSFDNPAQRNKSCMIEDEELVRAAVEKLKKLKRAGSPIANSDRQLDILVEQSLGRNDGVPGCHMMYESLYIRPNGDIEACGHMSLGRMGNVSKQSLCEVLNSAHAYAVRHGVSRSCRCQGNAYLRKSLGDKAVAVRDLLGV